MESTDVGHVSVQVRPPWTFWFYFFSFLFPARLWIDDRRIGWIWWWQTTTVELLGEHEISVCWWDDLQTLRYDVRPGELVLLRYRPPRSRISSGKLTEVPGESPADAPWTTQETER
jgi:hypothetical protein